ncbi:inositol diphosphatase DSP1-like isoform X2 [Wolffia australiana]
MEELLTPPKNFAMVESGIYRSEFVESSNYSFLDSLNLRSILCLCKESHSEATEEFISSRGIRLFQLNIDCRKGSLVGDDEEAIAEALKILTDSTNHPVLIQYQSGKVSIASQFTRAGCILVGCFRKLQSWSMAAILDEYQRFSAKARVSDLRFISKLDGSSISCKCTC